MFHLTEPVLRNSSHRGAHNAFISTLPFIDYLALSTPNTEHLEIPKLIKHFSIIADSLYLFLICELF